MLSDLFELFHECGRRPCLRAHACRAAGGPCLGDFPDAFRDLIAELPGWAPLRAALAAAGMAAEEEED